MIRLICKIWLTYQRSDLDYVCVARYIDADTSGINYLG